MGQVMLVGTTSDWSHQISVNLNSYLGCDVIARPNLKEAEALLKILPEVDLLILDQHHDATETREFLNVIASRNLMIPVILTNHNQYLKLEEYPFVDGPYPALDWRKIILRSAFHLGISSAQMSRHTKADFTPVPLYYFKFVRKSCVPVFLKVQQNDKIKFWQKFPSNQLIADSDMDIFTAEGLKCLFVSKEDFLRHFNFFSSKLSEMLEDEDTELGRRLSLAENAYLISSHFIRNYGIRESVVGLCQTIADSLVYSTNDLPSITIYLDKARELSTVESHRLFHLAGILGYEVIRRVEWGNQAQFEKLALALSFSDMLFKNPKLALDLEEINSQGEDHWPSRHAELMGNMLEASRIVPAGIPQIVREHHAGPQGGNHEYSPLSMTAMVSIYLATQILKSPRPQQEIADLLQKLSKKFVHPSFGNIINALEKRFSPGQVF